MEIGLCVASKIDDVAYVERAEQLGYRHAWFADSQMIWSDCYAVMALAATRTKTMRLGTGVSVVGTRLAPVTAHSIATINQLAPGRTFLALGNGNTAWRLMGHKPVTLAAFEDYVRVCRGLLDGEEVTFTHRGRSERISFQMPDRGFIGLEPRIPIYISGFGPKAQALAGRYGEGLVMSIPPDPAAFDRIWAHVVAGADEAGRTVDRNEFLTCSLSCACVLRAGEDLTSDRVIDTVGFLRHLDVTTTRMTGSETTAVNPRPIWPTAGRSTPPSSRRSPSLSATTASTSATALGSTPSSEPSSPRI